MSENVGKIFYEVDAQTDSLITAERRANKSLDELQSGFSDTDKAAAKTQKSIDKTASGMDGMTRKAGSLGTALTPLAAAMAGIITAQTLATWGRMAEEFTLLQARITRLSADADTARVSYQALLSIASTTGSTMGDTVKLWESLTGTLKSLGATNAQVLTLTSTLQKIGTIGGSSAEETANALRQLGQGLASGTLRAEEFNAVIEGTPELARQMAAGFGLSMGELRKAVLEGKVTAEALFEVLLGRTAEVDREFAKLPRTVSQAANAITTQFGAALSVIDQMIGASQKLAKIMDGLARGIQLTFNPSDQQKLAQLIQDRAAAEQQYQTQVRFGLKTTAEGTQAKIDGINKEIQAIQDRRIAEQKALSSGGSTTARGPASTTEDGQKAVQALAEQNQQLRAQGVERAKIIALQKVGANATQSEKDAAVALAVENFNLQEAEKKAQKDRQAGISAISKAETEAARKRRQEERETRREEEQTRKGTEQNIQVFAKLGVELASVGKTAREVAQDQAALALNKYATPEQVESVRTLAGALYDAKFAQQQLAAADPVAAAGINFQEQLTQLQELNAQKLLSDQQYLELKNAAETQYDAQRLAAQEQIFAAQNRGNALLIDSLNALQGTSTQVFSGLITGAMSGTDAVRALANTVLNQAVGAVVEWGFAQVKAIVMGQSAQAAATTAGIAQGAALASAYGPAAIAASIASFGAAPIAATSSMAANVPAMTALLAVGGRRHGGPVEAGSMYRVNEGGKPEVFNSGGQQYMIPNQRGEVVSNKDATAGDGSLASPISIQVINNSSNAQVRTETRQDEQGRFVSFFIDDVESGGPMTSALMGRTNLQRVGD